MNAKILKTMLELYDMMTWYSFHSFKSIKNHRAQS